MKRAYAFKGASYRLFFFGVVLSLAIVFATELRAADPCCNITGVNYQTGMVTARNTATGQTFQFQVGNLTMLKTLSVGQEVYADFGTKQVSVDGLAPCCNIVNLQLPLR